MKLLFIHPSVELYGADKILLYILEILHKDNEITVLLPKDGILVQYIKNISSKINIVLREDMPIVHSKIGIKKLITLPLWIRKFSCVFEKSSFDFVYCNTLATVPLLFTNWSKIKICHVHEIIENSILNFGFSLLLKLGANKVICVSEHVKQHLLFSKKYTVVHNGIPDLAQSKILENEKTNSYKVRFVLPGRYMPKKGQWFLVEALKKLSEDELNKCEFLLYGSPPPNRPKLGEELKTLVTSSNLMSYVHLFPFTNDINEIYENADVILIPSIMADPFPTTVLEAMMFSKPLISTNHGGASEIIDDNFGKLISPNDTDAFVNAIRYFIKNISCLCEFGKNARKKYENYLTVNHFKNRFINELFGEKYEKN